MHGPASGRWSLTADAIWAERPWPTFDPESSPRRWFDFFLGETVGFPGGVRPSGHGHQRWLWAQAALSAGSRSHPHKDRVRIVGLADH